MTPDNTTAGTTWVGLGTAWWALDAAYRAVYQGLPPWAVVPPLLFGAAALWNARTNARRLAKEKARP